jgi:hypothetical protein
MAGVGIAIVLVFYLVFLGGIIALAVMYLLNLQNLLKEIDPANRKVEPGNVWLMLIPLFNIVYPFILYPNISDSLKKEFESRGIPEQGDYYRSIGITMPILGLCGIIPVLGILAAIANLVLWIMYWVKMSEYKNKLKTSPKAEGVGVSSSTDILD